MDYEPNLTVRPPLLLLTTKTKCWKCKADMAVAGLGAYFVEEDGEEVIASDDHKDMAMLTNIEAMPDAVFAELVKHNPQFQKRYSRRAGETYYANTCKCGSLTGDFYLFSEPDGAFFPTTAEDAAAITVTHLPFTGQLEFRGGYGVGTGDFILEHADQD